MELLLIFAIPAFLLLAMILKQSRDTQPTNHTPKMTSKMNKWWCDKCQRKVNQTRAQRCGLNGCPEKSNVIPIQHQLPAPPTTTPPANEKTYQLVVGDVQTGFMNSK